MKSLVDFIATEKMFDNLFELRQTVPLDRWFDNNVKQLVDFGPDIARQVAQSVDNMGQAAIIVAELMAEVRGT